MSRMEGHAAHDCVFLCRITETEYVWLDSLCSQILPRVSPESVIMGHTNHTLTFCPFVLLGFSSTFSAAEESIVPLAAPGPTQNKYEVSSQASLLPTQSVSLMGCLKNDLPFYISQNTRVETLIRLCIL